METKLGTAMYKFVVAKKKIIAKSLWLLKIMDLPFYGFCVFQCNRIHYVFSTHKSLFFVTQTIITIIVCPKYTEILFISQLEPFGPLFLPLFLIRQLIYVNLKFFIIIYYLFKRNANVFRVWQFLEYKPRNIDFFNQYI